MIKKTKKRAPVLYDVAPSYELTAAIRAYNFDAADDLAEIIRALPGFKGAAPWRNNSTSDIGRQI